VLLLLIRRGRARKLLPRDTAERAAALLLDVDAVRHYRDAWRGIVRAAHDTHDVADTCDTIRILSNKSGVQSDRGAMQQAHVRCGVRQS
jgi:hypothetical protein